MMIGRNEPCPCGSGKKFKKCCQDLPARTPSSAQTPCELLRQRFYAAREGDFGFIYDTTHPEGMLRQHYPEKSDYVLYGQQTLLQGFRPLRCRGGQQRQTENGDVELIFWLETQTQDGIQNLYELGRFVQLEEGWRYHSGQKLSGEDFNGAFDSITFEHFDQVRTKIIY